MLAMDNRAWWIWLQNALGAGTSKHTRILEHYLSVQAFYEAGERAWKAEKYLTPRELGKLKRFSPEAAEAQLSYAEKLGQQILTPDMPAYPEKLHVLPDYPCVLYIQGQLPPVDFLLSVSMVGTRKATDDGLSAAYQFGRALAKAGAIVVSGGALGIDTQAHRGALAADGYTICVLGCSLENDYLVANAKLREQIARTGALVTEYPPGTAAWPANFPIRNRIISGLSDAVLVVEAAARSGALITAHNALDQGREVFAVPGSVTNPMARGTNALLLDGCPPATCPADILRCFQTRYHVRMPMEEALPVEECTRPIASAEPLPPKDLSEDAAALYAALMTEPQSVDALCAASGLPVERLLTAVTELELRGLATGASGQRYRRS